MRDGGRRGYRPGTLRECEMGGSTFSGRVIAGYPAELRDTVPRPFFGLVPQARVLGSCR